MGEDTRATTHETQAGPTPAPLALSVIIPVYNEEGNLDHLYGRLSKTLREYGLSHEILFVDDGSTDQSAAILRRLYESDSSVRVVRFARNFGQQMAWSAGLRYARGEMIVQLDADLQTAPEEIPKLVDKLREGYDVVYGVRSGRVGSLVRRAGSWLMSNLLYRVTGIDIPDSASGFTALDRRFVNTINLYNEKSRYLNGLLAWLSYGRWSAVPVAHMERNAGESKYTIPQLVALTLNFVCNFTVMPLRFASYLGWPLLGLSILALVWLISAYALGFLAENGSIWILVATLSFFSAVQLIGLGILGEYVGRMYREVRDQPSFVVREILEHDSRADIKTGRV
ncbi:MAG: glycosyltransferase family 2 protein [Candidatus Hydrogenedentes bacterium]|nr:glycosyltransferase family 2 protein [Candidatus Hydrogenedentota bacterium]